VEGSLGGASDVAVEEHMQGCSSCATYADGYAAFLHAFAKAVDSPALQGAVERLDARMVAARQSAGAGTRLGRIARRVFELGPVLQLGTDRLRVEAQKHPQWALDEAAVPPWRAASSVGGQSEGAPVCLDCVVVVDEFGVEARTMAFLATPPCWPSEHLDLLLEFDLKYTGWGASVSYVLDDEGAQVGRPSALELFEGAVDAEGLVEIQRRWQGPAPSSFCAERLRICLVASGVEGPSAT
jgi:hypothetical protein